MMHSRSLLGSMVSGLVCLISCAHPSSQPVVEASRAPNAPIELSADLRVYRLIDNVYVHESMFDLPDLGLVPSNGLILLAADGAILIDTPWTNAQTAMLLDWVKSTLKTEVRELIVTHSHDDRMGGINEIISRNIRSHAFVQTAQLAQAAGHSVPQNLFGELQLFNMLGESIETFYPGPGHSSDNIVVWVPKYKLLFGGCFVRPLASDTLGNADSATVQIWKNSMGTLIERYANAEIVVPGHGQPGSRDVLLHTRQLLEQRAATAKVR